MTQEEMERRAQRLIDAANRETAAKNKEYEKKSYEERCEAAARRTARSSILTDILEYLQAECTEAIAKIQRELDEDLEELYAQEITDSQPGEVVDAPYLVDYSLPMSERYIIVKEYYLSYEDVNAALADYRADEIAKEYLGKFYSNILQLLISMT